MKRWSALVVSALCVVSGALAQPYPGRPVRLVVPFPAGGTSDVIARSVTTELDRQLGQPFLIDNRGGANGIIGTDLVAKSAADGYTLLHVTAAFAINPSVYRKLPYRVEDFAPVTNLALGAGYLLVVHPSVAASSAAELIALAKQKAGRLSYGSPGVGNTLHLAVEYFDMKAGVQITHVPYKGVAPALTALLANEVQVMLVPPIISVQHVRSGRLRALGFTGKTRWGPMPDVPTVGEAAIPGFFIIGGWHGWLAPARTPASILGRIQSEVHRALQLPKVREYLAEGGYEADGRSPAEFGRFLQEEVSRNAEIVRATRLEPQ